MNQTPTSASRLVETAALQAPPAPRGWLASLFPDSLAHLSFWGLALWQWVGLVGSALLAWLLASLLSSLITSVLKKITQQTSFDWDDTLVDASRRPGRLLLATLFFRLCGSQLSLPPEASTVVEHVVYTGVVWGLAWFVFRLIHTGASIYEGLLPDDTAGELRARGLRTRISVARSIASALVLLSTGAILLLQFEVVRSVGVSLLASAGVAGVVLGFAAQKSLAGVIAGIQLSIAQPVRIGDLVQLDGEFGTIEEINLTYVVVKLWDERRLVVPISKFIETTFQNWSKMGLEMQGVVVVHADPTLPVPLLRAELERLCKEHKLWDGRKCVLQVTDASADSITLRALVSVAKVDDLFDLRCDIREGLVRYLSQLDGGAYLPRRRWQTVEEPPHPPSPLSPPDGA